MSFMHIMDIFHTFPSINANNMTIVPAHEIPKDVETIKIWHLTAPVDVATGYGLPNFMWISKNGQDVI